MTSGRIILAVAAVSVAMLTPVNAMPFSLAPAKFVASDTQTMWHPVVWQCAWKKVCVKWGGGHICKEWTLKKVCNPDLNSSEAPPSVPKRISKKGLKAGTEGASVAVDPSDPNRPGTTDLPAVQNPRLPASQSLRLPAIQNPGIGRVGR